MKMREEGEGREKKRRRRGETEEEGKRAGDLPESWSHARRKVRPGTSWLDLRSFLFPPSIYSSPFDINSWCLLHHFISSLITIVTELTTHLCDLHYYHLQFMLYTLYHTTLTSAANVDAPRICSTRLYLRSTTNIEHSDQRAPLVYNSECNNSGPPSDRTTRQLISFIHIFFIQFFLFSAVIQLDFGQSGVTWSAIRPLSFHLPIPSFHPFHWNILLSSNLTLCRYAANNFTRMSAAIPSWPPSYTRSTRLKTGADDRHDELSGSFPTAPASRIVRGTLHRQLQQCLHRYPLFVHARRIFNEKKAQNWKVERQGSIPERKWERPRFRLPREGMIVHSCIWSDLGLVLRPELRGRCGTRLVWRVYVLTWCMHARTAIGPTMNWICVCRVFLACFEEKEN